MAQYQPMYDSFDRSLPERYVPTARMSVSASVYLPGSEVDMYTGQLKPDRQRRRRTQAKRLEHERLEREQKRLEESVQREMNKGGVRISVRAGILMIAALFFVCGLGLLMKQGEIVACQKEVNRLQNAIAECRSENNSMAALIAEKSDEAQICYAASQELHMIPAASAEAIHLTAVDTRPNRTNVQAQQNAAITAILQVQTTAVPMAASN